MWLHFPCLIVVDHIEQHTAQIRAVGQRGMHRGPSPNAMMWSVHQAHEVVTKLSRLLTPTVLMFCTAMAVNASNWVVYVALPRQHVDVNPRFTQFLGVSVQIALATWSLHGAANCSAACDELLHAITELKVTRPKDIVRCAAQPRCCALLAKHKPCMQAGRGAGLRPRPQFEPGAWVLLPRAARASRFRFANDRTRMRAYVLGAGAGVAGALGCHAPGARQIPDADVLGARLPRIDVSRLGSCHACPWAVASRGSADLGRGIGPRLVAR